MLPQAPPYITDQNFKAVVYDPCVPRVLRVLSYLGVNGPELGYAAAEVFDRVRKNRDRFSPDFKPIGPGVSREEERARRLVSWVISIAYNVVREQRRNDSRRSVRIVLESSFPAESKPPEAISDDRGAEEELNNAQVLGLLRAALDGLTPEEREVIVGRYVAELTFDELAVQLSRSRSSIDRLNQSTLKKLRSQLKILNVASSTGEPNVVVK